MVCTDGVYIILREIAVKVIENSIKQNTTSRWGLRVSGMTISCDVDILR